jgi:hypothetical protein
MNRPHAAQLGIECGWRQRIAGTNWRTALPGLWLVGTAVWWSICCIAILTEHSPREPVTMMFGVPAAVVAVSTALWAGLALLKRAASQPIDREFWRFLLIVAVVALALFFYALLAYEALEPPRRSFSGAP